MGDATHLLHFPQCNHVATHMNDLGCGSHMSRDRALIWHTVPTKREVQGKCDLLQYDVSMGRATMATGRLGGATPRPVLRDI
jgi:hypothetical protein